MASFGRTALALGLGLALMVAGPARAEKREGPCQLRDGICYRSLDEVVDAATHRRYVRTRPAKPLGLLGVDLATGRVRRIARPISARLAPGGFPPAGDLTPRALTIVDRPWTDPFFRTNVKIEAQFPQQPAGTISLCSGTMVGSHTVLTAGHCIFSHDYGGWAEAVWVYPAMAGYHHTPYGESSAAAAADALVSTTWWAVDHDHRGDTGIVRLAQNTGDLTGWAELVWGYGSLDQTLFAAGYPSEENFDGLWLYTDSGSVQSLTDYLICHSMGTKKGMSGGPGWIEDQGAQEVTAVNSYCEEGGLCCMARYIDEYEDLRLASEAETAGQPPDHWTCPLAQFSASDGCQCLCGVFDPDCLQAAQPADGCAADERCIPPGVCACAPDCAGRQCGPHGCGGVCGYCDGAPCVNGVCDCQPSCAGRQCGSDGCGGSCGSCPDGQTCEGNQCVCAPDCTDAVCGSDGCGGTCGDCPPGQGCVAGACTCVPDCSGRQCGSDGCDGSCGSCAGDQECISGQCVCTYNCIDRECGSDGCGGSCGTCVEGAICKKGKCVGEDAVNGGCGCASASPAAAAWPLLILLPLIFRRRRA